MISHKVRLKSSLTYYWCCRMYILPHSSPVIILIMFMDMFATLIIMLYPPPLSPNRRVMICRQLDHLHDLPKALVGGSLEWGSHNIIYCAPISIHLLIEETTDCDPCYMLLLMVQNLRVSVIWKLQTVEYERWHWHQFSAAGSSKARLLLVLDQAKSQYCPPLYSCQKDAADSWAKVTITSL